MPKRRDTKRMFADELEAMMQRAPLSKVHVNDLCAHCGVERRVFYYHFRDKYDLVAWMFEQDYSVALQAGGPFTLELYAQTHQKLWERRGFYRRALEEDEQNSIGRYLLQMSVDANEAALRRYLGTATLPREAVVAARHFAHGNIGCVIDWLRGIIDATPKQLAESMFASMPDVLRRAYEESAGGKS